VSPDFANSINTNTNIKCIFGLNDPDTADFYARHLGTSTTNKITEQIEQKGFFKKHEETGKGSSREVESYKVHPNILKELFYGKGVLHVPTHKGSVTEVIQYYTIHSSKEVEIYAKEH
jgi:type IV secretory pathway TraG/TraD family ATPase VirD4